MQIRRCGSRLAQWVMALPVVFVGCGGSGDGSGPKTGVDVSGSVQVSASDASSAGLAFQSGAPVMSKAVLGGATVSAYKILADGTTRLQDTTTTDSSGNYRFANLPKPKGETGLATDFYYEIRVSAGSLDVRAPAAPTVDATVDVTPESNLAAKILSSVVNVPTSSANPTANLELIEAARHLVTQNATGLSGSISIPSVATSAASETAALASGLAAAGGNAEKIYKAAQFNSEYVWLTTSANGATTEQAASYLKRLLREGCNQPSTQPLPYEAALVMGQALLAGTTYTVTDVVAAYSAASGQNFSANLAKNQFNSVLTAITTNFAADAGAAVDFTAEEQLVLNVRRKLGERTFTTTTELAPDQALALLMTIPGPGNFCQLGSTNINEVLGSLTGDSTLSTAHLADVQINHDSGFGCTQNGEAHFRADIEVYTPSGVTVTGVTVASTDTNLNGTGTVNLTAAGTHWTSSANGICVTLGLDVDYTVTATLSSGGPLTTTVSRNHPAVPEASTTVGGVAASTNVLAPTVVADKRPVFSWESPAEKLAQITNPPAGSRVKYTYEFAHVDVNDNSLSPLSACDQVSTSGVMYEVDSFLPTVDCDVAACAAAASINESDVRCRMNIQTYLVDDSDRLLGQAAGNFPVFCVDTNGDSDCGN